MTPTWEHIVRYVGPTLVALTHKLEGLDPNDKCAVAACQAAIRVYRDLLNLPTRLQQEAAARGPQG